MKDNKGMGVVEVIVTLAILILFVLLFGDKLAELMSRAYTGYIQVR